MNKSQNYTIDDLLSLFEDVLSPADAIAAKLMAQISSSITRERVQLKMTQSDFARHIGVRQSQVSRWEHGDYNFTLEKIADIAAKLDLDVNISVTPIAVYKSLNAYSSGQFISPQPFSFTYNSCNEKGNNLSYIPKDILPPQSHIKEDSKYVKLC